jgi:hypothetical protein
MLSGDRREWRQSVGGFALATLKENSMKTILTAALLSLFAASASAQGTTCSMQASEKKLAGAAKTSFMKKCETDASKACDADSKAKKLSGAAKTSHMKKCVSDAVGS